MDGAGKTAKVRAILGNPWLAVEREKGTSSYPICSRETSLEDTDLLGTDLPAKLGRAICEETRCTHCKIGNKISGHEPAIVVLPSGYGKLVVVVWL